MKLISVGFFSELPYGNKHGLQLRDLVSKFFGADIDQAVAYLKSGAAFIVSPGLCRDQLSDDHEIIGPLKLLTDGKFLWPSDLAFYVQRYKVAIPSDFLSHMEGNGWKVPAVDISTLEA